MPNPDIALQVEVMNPGEYFACCGLLELADRALTSGAEGWFEDRRFLVARRDPSDRVSINDILWSLVNVPIEPESESSTSPLSLDEPISMRLDWWLTLDGKNSALKTWAGNQKSPKMFRKWQDPLKDVLDLENSDPNWLFHQTCRLQGPYGFDSGIGWNALSVGFSLNEHDPYKELPSRPVVEILGSIGLQRFFPEVGKGRDSVLYTT